MEKRPGTQPFSKKRKPDFFQLEAEKSINSPLKKYARSGGVAREGKGKKKKSAHNRPRGTVSKTRTVKDFYTRSLPSLLRNPVGDSDLKNHRVYQKKSKVSFVGRSVKRRNKTGRGQRQWGRVLNKKRIVHG